MIPGTSLSPFVRTRIGLARVALALAAIAWSATVEAAPRSEQPLPLGDGTPVVLEARLPADTSDSAAIYLALTPITPGDEHGGLWRAVELPGDADLHFTRLSNDRDLKALKLCRTSTATFVVALTTDDQLVKRSLADDAAWELIAARRRTSPLRCADASGEDRTATSPTLTPGRLWSGLKARAQSCPRGTGLARSHISVSGRLVDGRLEALHTTLGTEPSPEILRRELAALRACLASRLAQLTGTSRVSGDFSGSLPPPLQLPSSVELQLSESGRATLSLRLNPAYGRHLEISTESSSVALNTAVSGLGGQRHLYVSAPRSGGDFDATITVRTNLPSLPKVEIPVRGRFARSFLDIQPQTEEETLVGLASGG